MAFLFVSKRVRLRRGGPVTKLARVLVAAAVIALLVGTFTHHQRDPNDESSYVPAGAPSYCVGDDPSPAAVGATEAQIDEFCPQSLGYRQELYRMNQGYASSSITTVPYPWCVAGRPCPATADQTGTTDSP